MAEFVSCKVTTFISCHQDVWGDNYSKYPKLHFVKRIVGLKYQKNKQEAEATNVMAMAKVRFIESIDNGGTTGIDDGAGLEVFNLM